MRKRQRIHRTTHLTPEEIASDQAVRDAFRDHPSWEELVAQGEIDPDATTTLGAYLETLQATRRQARW